MDIMCRAALMLSCLIFIITLPISTAAAENNDKVEIESGNANAFIDEAIVHWRSYLRESGYDPLHVDSFTKDVVSCWNCRLDGLSTINRTGDVTLNASQTFMVVDLNVGFETLYAECTCQARWTVFTADGKMTATIAHYNLAGRIEQDSNAGGPPRLSHLMIVDEGELDTYFRGSGFLGTLVQWFGQGLIRSRIRYMLSNVNEMSRYLNQSLAKMNLQSILTML